MSREPSLPLITDPAPPPIKENVKSWCSCSDTDKRYFGMCGRCPDHPCAPKVNT